MLAALLAVGASLAWGVADFLGGLKSRTVPLLTVLLLAQPVALLAFGAAVAIRGEAPPGSAVFWAVPAAVCGSLGLAAFYKGMAVGAISVVAPIAATAAVIPVAAGLATGDRPSVVQEAGFVVALAGVVLASREPGGTRGASRIAAGVPWGLAAAVGFGGYFVPMHAASGEDVLWAVLILRLSGAALFAGVWLLTRPSLGVSRPDLAAIVAIGVLDSGANLLFAAAASMGLVSVVSVLASLYPVATVALARFYLRERVGRVQEAGVAAALAGVVLVSAG